MVLVSVEFYDVVDALYDDGGVERFVHDIGHAQLVAFERPALVLIARDQYDRDIVDSPCAVHVLQDTEAVKHGHEQIKKHYGKLPARRVVNDPERVFAVLCLQDLIAVIEQLRYDDTVDIDIINHQQFAFDRQIPLRIAMTEQAKYQCYIIF
jgi:hypothetical protein